MSATFRFITPLGHWQFDACEMAWARCKCYVADDNVKQGGHGNLGKAEHEALVLAALGLKT